jgi:hypothetical protein
MNYVVYYVECKECILELCAFGIRLILLFLCPVLVYTRIFENDRVKDDILDKRNPISERKEVAETLKMPENKGLLRILGLHSEGIIG